MFAGYTVEMQGVDASISGKMMTKRANYESLVFLSDYGVHGGSVDGGCQYICKKDDQQGLL